jgi:Na+/H+ antiporter NhaD/arsenite permease-like protein
MIFIPFIAVLLSLALGPALLKEKWNDIQNRFFGFVLCWFVMTMGLTHGVNETTHRIIDTILNHYLPFIGIIGCLYTLSLGIKIRIHGDSSILANVIILLMATLMGSIMGTTGAALVFIKPFLELNKNRTHCFHLILFYIILVCNIGGVLSPLGDPPLFLGYLHGISFLWPLTHLNSSFIVGTLWVLCLFAITDYFFNKKIIAPFRISCHGWIHILLLMMANLVVFFIPQLTHIVGDWGNIIQIIILFCIGLLSYLITSQQVHIKKHLSFTPLKEVIEIFFMIFLTLIPIEMALSETNNIIAPLLQNHHIPSTYFWMSGALSAFLDNAPTYMIFYYLLGGDSSWLMNDGSQFLKAISMGSVFMGALTYIGNAPNLMVKSIADNHHFVTFNFWIHFVLSLAILMPFFIYIIFNIL